MSPTLLTQRELIDSSIQDLKRDAAPRLMADFDARVRRRARRDPVASEEGEKQKARHGRRAEWRRDRSR
ncbi:hypothetical protein BLAT2472_10845 [Burkholderia latens]